MISVLLGLRLGRWGVFGFSLAALMSVFAQTAGFYQIAGHTLVQRLQFGASMAALEAQFVALFAPTIRPDTVEGFVEFRGFNSLTILFAVWALASATGFARGDETRGIVEMELATGTPRPVLLAARSAAFAIAVSVASIAAAAGFVIGVATNHDTVEARPHAARGPGRWCAHRHRFGGCAASGAVSPQQPESLLFLAVDVALAFTVSLLRPEPAAAAGRLLRRSGLCDPHRVWRAGHRAGRRRVHAPRRGWLDPAPAVHLPPGRA